MSRMVAVATTTAVQTVNLTPQQRTKLRTNLAAIADLKNEIDALKADLEARTAVIEEIRESTGLKEFEFEGAKVNRVSGDTTYIDWDWLIGEGIVSPSQKEEATKKKAKKPYTLVTLPKGEEK